MSNHLIFWPLLAQMLIPVLVLMLNAKRKAADVKAGNFNREKAAIDNEAWSLPVILTSKSLANQFQLPVLFYVLCLVLAQISAVNTYILTIAWLFVVTRYAHAYVHVSSNNVPMRLRAFLFGAFFLLCLLVMTILALLRA